MPPRILVTRASLEPLGQALRHRGLQPVHLPLVRLVPTHQPPPAPRPQQVLVTSASAVRFCPSLAHHTAGASVVAVGDVTAAALGAAGISVTSTGRAGGAEAVALLRASVGPTWFVGAAVPSASLRRAMDQWAQPIIRWAVYAHATPAAEAEDVRACLPVDAVALASGSAVTALAARVGLGQLRLVVIGPKTAAEVVRCGGVVAGVAAQPNLRALADAVAALCALR